MASTTTMPGLRFTRTATLAATSLLSAASAMHGCASVGPAAIANGRTVYNQVITQTSSEQLLAMIVRLRYGEPFGLLNVASVTASLKLSASVGAQVGVGPQNNYSGNLVPLSGGVAYEENPTISYIPMSTEHVMTRMLAPLPLDVLIPLMRSAADLEGAIMLLVSRMNTLRKAHDARAAPPPEFTRAAHLMGELRRGNMLDFGLANKDHSEILLIIHSYKGRADAEVDELLALLNLEGTESRDGGIMVPVEYGVLRNSRDLLLIESLPLIKLVQQMGFYIQVPPEHLKAGIAMYSDAPPPPENGPLIRTSRSRPTNATVMTQYRDYWYYIDESDSKSKLLYMQMMVIIGLRLSNPAGDSPAPVLTIPVGG